MTTVATPGRGLGRNALSDLSRVLHDCHAHVISRPRGVLTEADVEDEDEEQGLLVPTIADPLALHLAAVQLKALPAAVQACAGAHATAPPQAFFTCGRPQS